MERARWYFPSCLSVSMISPPIVAYYSKHWLLTFPEDSTICLSRLFIGILYIEIYHIFLIKERENLFPGRNAVAISAFILALCRVKNIFCMHFHSVFVRYIIVFMSQKN